MAKMTYVQWYEKLGKNMINESAWAKNQNMLGLDVSEHVDKILNAEYQGYLNYRPVVSYQYTSTKEYHDAFPCAYRQWRADSRCRFIHGYSFSMKFYFGTNDLDIRRWAMDYGGLKELKQVLESQFDHTTLCSSDDPHLDWYKEAEKRGIIKLTVLPNLGCESLADLLYNYVNGVYIPDMLGPNEAERLWCYRVEIRETQSNMAFREGHRCWNESLLD